MTNENKNIRSEAASKAWETRRAAGSKTTTTTTTEWTAKLGGSEFRIMRLNDAPVIESETMDTPERIAAYLKANVVNSLTYKSDVENFIVVHLNTRKKIIGFEVISNGTLDTILVHPREVFKSACIANSASIVLAHNHPSGDPTPSEADIKVTRELIRAGQMMHIEVTDHVILGATRHTSLREQGYFYN